MSKTMIDSFWNTRIHERKFRIERTKYIIIDVQQTVPCAELEGERSKIGIRPLPTNKKNPLEPSLPVIFFLDTRISVQFEMNNRE